MVFFLLFFAKKVIFFSLLAHSISTEFEKDFVEQLKLGFSDKTQKAGSDRLQKSVKSVLSPLQLISISQISSKSISQDILTLFYSIQISTNRRTHKESF